MLNVMLAQRDAVVGGLLMNGVSPGKIVKRFERGIYGWGEVRAMFTQMNPDMEIWGLGEQPMLMRRKLDVVDVEDAYEAVAGGDWDDIPALGGGA